jgi:hypothetical protein
MTVSFALGSASWQPTVNAFTIVAAETNALAVDQATIVMTIDSTPTASLDDVTGALQGAGVSGASFSGVSTGPLILGPGPGLNWSFSLVVPLSKLNSTLTQLTRAQQTLVQQSPGLVLAFNVSGLSSSQAQQPSCPDATLVAEALTQAQQVATAATLALGPVLSMATGQNLSAAVESGEFYSSTGLAAFTSGLPFSSVSVCLVKVRYQLLY